MTPAMASGAARSTRLSERSVFFFQAEDGIRDLTVTGVQTCALPISLELPAFEPIDLVSVVRRGELRGGAVLAAQESGGEGPVGQERDLTLPAQRELPLLNVSIEQVVRPLVSDHRGDLQRPRERGVRG